MYAHIGITAGFSVVLQRYFVVGLLFTALGCVMLGGVLGLFGFQAEDGFVVGCLFFSILGSCFFVIGIGILLAGVWWLRRATWLLRYTTPVLMHLTSHTRLVHNGGGPGPGDVVLTAFARLIPVEAAAGIRQFKRVPLEWPTWSLRWQGVHDETVRVYYDFVHGGPLVIETDDNRLFVSQLFWDRTRRRRQTNPPGWQKEQ